MLTVQQSSSFEAGYVLGTSGRVGHVGVQIIDGPSSTVVTARTTVGVVETPAGSGVYWATLTAPASAGQYAVVWDDDSLHSAAEDLLVTVAPPAPTPSAAGASLVCELWADPAALGCTGSYGDLEWASQLASDLLYTASARQYPGSCTSTVRPSKQGCGCWAGAWDPGWAWQGSWWYAAPIGTPFLGCGASTRLRLPGGATDVVSVTIDGAAFSGTKYRLDGDYLVRTDGAAWPLCQDLSAPSTGVGSFIVSYKHGKAPPPLGVQAARDLACQLYASINPQSGSCMLPPNVTSVVTQGVTYARTAAAELAKGQSGVTTIDVFIASVNPNNLSRPPAVWSPDLPRYERTT